MKNEVSTGNKTIKLPLPVYKGKISVEEALVRRRSVRDYKNEPVALSDISQLLWAAQGITDPLTDFRTAPSAGAQYPLEVYIVAGNVSGLPAGIYKYKSLGHELLRISDGDKRKGLCNAALDQEAVRDAASIMVFTAVCERTTVKYGERGKRYVYMEAGHAAQNVYLQAVSLNLGTVVIGAFTDNEVKKVLNIPENELPLYLMPIGKK